MAPKPASSPMFDVAISFAGTERKLAQELATRVKTAVSRFFTMSFSRRNSGVRTSESSSMRFTVNAPDFA
jgi:hypothetical protein